MSVFILQMSSGLKSLRFILQLNILSSFEMDARTHARTHAKTLSGCISWNNMLEHTLKCQNICQNTCQNKHIVTLVGTKIGSHAGKYNETHDVKHTRAKESANVVLLGFSNSTFRWFMVPSFMCVKLDLCLTMAVKQNNGQFDSLPHIHN